MSDRSTEKVSRGSSAILATSCIMLRTLLLFQKKTFKNFSYKDNNNSRTGERERE